MNINLCIKTIKLINKSNFLKQISKNNFIVLSVNVKLNQKGAYFK